MILLLVCSLALKGQGEIDSVTYKDINIILEVLPVSDYETKAVFKNVDLTILGTDGSLRKYKSDSLDGVFPIIRLKHSTSYSIIVSKNKYLSA